MGRNLNSKYILTCILAMKCFQNHFNNASFCSYFFPFIANKKNEPYQDGELKEKEKNIREGRHGYYRNFASQGFGGVAFDSTQITFQYFYQRLCKFDIEKFGTNEVERNLCGMESRENYDELFGILNRQELYLFRKKPVIKGVREELKDDLENQGVKYVLAKLFYYILGDNHILPDVDKSLYQDVLQNLQLKQEGPNVFVSFRKNLNDTDEKFLNRLLHAKEIKLLCHDGVSLFGDEKIAKNFHSKRDTIEYLMQENLDLQMEVILCQSENGTLERMEEFQVNLPHRLMKIEELSRQSLLSLNRMKDGLKEKEQERIVVKMTKEQIPYSIFIANFENEELDYAKVDLYSPFINENDERPSMYVFRKTVPQLYQHFKHVFESMWSCDRYSQFW